MPRTASDADRTGAGDADGHPHRQADGRAHQFGHRHAHPDLRFTLGIAVGSAAYRDAASRSAGRGVRQRGRPVRSRRAQAGAVTVPAGNNASLFGDQLPANTTYYFATGTHYLGSGEFAQINPGKNDTFTGAPGAIISGANPGSAGYHQNDFAFVGNDTGVTGVTIEYLTIENFSPPGSQGAVNTNSDDNWTIAHSTIKNNVPGAAMMVGSGNTIEHNCLTANGQYAFNAYQNPGDPQQSKVTGGPQNIVLSGNEISYNDTCNWEASGKFPVRTPAGCAGAGQSDGCGCSGGGKFWQAQNVTVKDNYVHDNYNVGIWADTNDDGFDIEGNYFSANFDAALVYEISYNALIKGNTFAGNAWDGRSG